MSPALPPKCLRIDEVDANTSYFGYAIPGSIDSDPVWRIMRLTLVGTETKIQYADGMNSNSVWNDRLSYTYI